MSLDPRIALFSSEQAVRACAEVAADHFNAATLNPEALVGLLAPDRDEVVKLRGWDSQAEAWLCEAVSGELLTASRIFDPYEARRILRLMVTGQRALYPWETAPPEVSGLRSLASEAVERLLEGGSHDSR